MSQSGRVFYKVVKILLMAIFFLIISYLFFALLLSFLSTHPPREVCNSSKKIFITTNGIHLDIVIPVAELEPEFVKNIDIYKDTKYVSFGWGDKDFYINTPQWSDLKFRIAFKSLFLKSESAMHVTYYPVFYNDWRSVDLCPQQLDILKSYIKNSFKTDNDGNLKKLSFPGYSYNDSFFEAHGSFTLFRTCNVWVNNGLKKTGIKTSLWSPFDFGVLYHLSSAKQRRL
jgi:uncharacterized protein (TIGR02117 family)